MLSIFQKATAEANNLAAAASAKDMYYNNMEEVCETCPVLKFL